MIKHQINSHGLIIYDGSCGVCTSFVGKNHKFFRYYGFEVTPLQAGGIVELTGLSEKELLQSIYILTPYGKLLRDADFFHYLTGKIWWSKPLFFLLNIPFIKFLFGKLYRYIAKRRHRISKVCRL
jgi:predicted DCC family thiol-disulfide oxidoreductase YuxK